jgi:hypothetical protein
LKKCKDDTFAGMEAAAVYYIEREGETDSKSRDKMGDRYQAIEIKA